MAVKKNSHNIIRYGIIIKTSSNKTDHSFSEPAFLVARDRVRQESERL